MCFHICSVSHLLHLHTHLLFLILILLIVLLLCFLAMNSLLGFACPCMLSGLILSGLAGYSLFQLWNWTRHQGLGCLRKTCPESYLLFLHRKPFIRFIYLFLLFHYTWSPNPFRFQITFPKSFEVIQKLKQVQLNYLYVVFSDVCMTSCSEKHEFSIKLQENEFSF